MRTPYEWWRDLTPTEHVVYTVMYFTVCLFVVWQS